MHKTDCMQSIENISIWEVFNSICPSATELSVVGIIVCVFFTFLPFLCNKFHGML